MINYAIDYLMINCITALLVPVATVWSSFFRRPLNAAGVLPVGSGWTRRADSQPSEVSWRSYGGSGSGSVCLSVPRRHRSLCLSGTHITQLTSSASTVWTRDQRLWKHRCPPPLSYIEGRYSAGCSSAHRGGQAEGASLSFFDYQVK